MFNKKPLYTTKSGPVDEQLSYAQALTQPILDGIGHEIKSIFGRAYSAGDKILTAMIMTSETVDDGIPHHGLTLIAFSDKEVSKFNREYAQDPNRPAFYRKKNNIRRHY